MVSLPFTLGLLNCPSSVSPERSITPSRDCTVCDPARGWHAKKGEKDRRRERKLLSLAAVKTLQVVAGGHSRQHSAKSSALTWAC